MKENINTTSGDKKVEVLYSKPDEELSAEEKLEIQNTKYEKILNENQELKQKLINRDKMFSIIAHDLKGPVGGIMNLAELMKDDLEIFDKEGIRNHIELIFKSSSDTYNLLENLLTWSRLQQDKVKLEISELDLSNQITESISPLLNLAQIKKINIKNEVKENKKVLADHNALSFIIRNLISNSIKFTNPDGNIIISQEGNDSFSITDDGVGMSEDQIKSIYDKNIASTKGTNKEGGTGLGLSICSEYIEKMGGNIKVESEEGKGTTFIISLSTAEKKTE